MSQNMIFKSNFDDKFYSIPRFDEDFVHAEPKPSNILFEFVKKAKNNSENPIRFVENVYQSCCNSVCFILTSLLLVSIPISMLVIGLIFRNDCPLEPRIPAWLIVSGIIGTVYGFSRIVMSVYVVITHKRKNQTQRREPCQFTCFFCFLSLFLFIWFLSGNVWVLTNFDNAQHDIKDKPNHCNLVLFYYAFWSIITCWVVIALTALFIIGIILFFVFSIIYYRVAKT